MSEILQSGRQSNPQPRTPNNSIGTSPKEEGSSCVGVDNSAKSDPDSHTSSHPGEQSSAARTKVIDISDAGSNGKPSIDKDFLKRDQVRSARRMRGKGGIHRDLKKIAQTAHVCVLNACDTHLGDAVKRIDKSSCREHIESRRGFLRNEGIRFKPLTFWQRRAFMRRVPVDMTLHGVKQWITLMDDLAAKFDDQLHLNCVGVRELGLVVSVLKNLREGLSLQMSELNQLAY